MNLKYLALFVITLLLVSCSDKVNLKRLSGGSAVTVASGVLDTSFGVAGANQIDDIDGTEANQNDELNAIVRDSSGSFFVTGTEVCTGPCAAGTRNPEMLIAKFTSAGVLDTTFGGGDGAVYVSQSTTDTIDEYGTDIGVLSTGEIVAVGATVPGTLPDLTFSKRDATGTTGTTVLFDGKDDAIENCSVAGANRADVANGLAINSSDQIYMVGYCDDEASAPDAGNLLLARLNSAGVADPSFSPADTAGWFSYGTDGDNIDHQGNDVFLDANENPIIAGTIVNGASSTIMLFKLNKADGTLDTTFSGDGIVDVGTNGQLDKGIVDSSGRIYVTGRSHDGTWDITVWRYTSAGTLDTTWGTGGELDFDNPFGGGGRGRDLKIDAAGNIVVFAHLVNAGGTDSTVIIRYTSSGVLDTSFASGAGYIVNSLDSTSKNQVLGGVIHPTTGEITTAGYVRESAGTNAGCSITGGNVCDLYLLRFE